MTEGRGRKTEKKVSFAERCRREAKRLGEFSARELADEVGVLNKREAMAVSSNIRGAILRGEMERLTETHQGRGGEGRYRYLGFVRQPSVRQRLWDVVRRMPTPFFTLKDLRQLTGAKNGTIKGFCWWIVQAGYVERLKKGQYRRVEKLAVAVPPDRRSAALEERPVGLEGRGWRQIKGEI